MWLEMELERFWLKGQIYLPAIFRMLMPLYRPGTMAGCEPVI